MSASRLDDINRLLPNESVQETYPVDQKKQGKMTVSLGVSNTGANCDIKRKELFTKDDLTTIGLNRNQY